MWHVINISSSMKLILHVEISGNNWVLAYN